MRTFNLLGAVGKGAAETIFPRKRSCTFCGRFWPGSQLSATLCPQCILQWRRLRQQTPICPLCGSFDGGNPCQGPCAENRHQPQAPAGIGSLDAIRAAAPYTGMYRQRIMAVKYNGQKQLAEPLGCLMADAWQDAEARQRDAWRDAEARSQDARQQEAWQQEARQQATLQLGAWQRGMELSSVRQANAQMPRAQYPAYAGRHGKPAAYSKPCLVPVPMHREKESARGYNQSRLLADAVRRETGFLVEELLARPHAGQMQAGLGKRQRQQALDQVFQWAGPKGHRPGPVIVIDDVVTTGATLESCGQILRQHGYGPIWGLAFAGGSGAGQRST